ncbi:helicase-associated domain-containing protein [Mycolicibacterium holsaticum]|uniref:helicase-associated domain-containing protein n=1 Tax=Mycolicibacterium holsaticum TaxID=152142 RepID=UPI001C7E0178|nr:helicase-associated domain-containing protein [Mycolicibacterium holsaticum]MDA4106292.1 DNA-binding protein [Mycolicibacterium holsaticum DSM 44478 = JCM 12374]QZA13396.1 helicase-associated domain-containing protein [Mycolicibacterium holsaticum DSM 44478 = JCM 12374]UNC09137.1 helicase-associated domain-containing protein [Mycolicibacterium holsaticum DSM 44478 = JCM 12374]
MSENPPVVPLGAWLADLPDERLIRLLELRPDLTQPPPGTIAALAARAQARQSVKAATDDLDYLQLAVLDGLLVLHADTTAVPLTKLLELLGDRADQDTVGAAVDHLRERALVWGDTAVRVVAEAAAGLPWFPGQATVENADPADLADRLAVLDEAQDELLRKLLEGSPVGRTRDAAPGTPSDRPVQRLLAAGLLRQLDSETVILPRLVGQVLRGELPGPVTLTPPDPVVSTTSAADVDAVAAGAVIDLLREVEVLLDTLSAAPVPELRSGGLGVRDLKRLAKNTGIEDRRLGLILELSVAAGLIAAGIPESEPPGDAGAYWTPTVPSDRFVESSTADKWHLLATTWLELPGRPGLIGARGPDGKPYAALSDSLFSTAAPLDRQLLLAVLADLPPGAGVDAKEASQAMIWRRPRWAVRLQPGPVGDLLAEAHALGVMGRGAITTPVRALLSGDSPDGVVKAMDKVLPKPIDHFLLQADLTVVVPGPLERGLAEQLAAVANVESAGAAMVYRISEASIRRALDTGCTAGELHSLFGRHSKTPVPQGLTYLIDDVARRHGQLRVGMAASFVRCEDAALLAQAVAAPATDRVELRLLAPTVAVSQAPIAEVLAALRAAGFAPAAEDSTGAIVDIRARGARVPAPTGRRRSYRPPTPTTQTLGAIVAVLRKVAATPTGNMRLDPAVAISQLQEAAYHQTSVVIGYVDPAGVATQRVVAPVNIRGGQLTAYDPASGRMREFAIHRVTSVVSADPQ